MEKRAVGEHEEPQTLLKIAELRKSFNTLERGELVAMCNILLDLYVQKSGEFRELCEVVEQLSTVVEGQN